MIADIIVIAVLLISALIAFLRGFIREVLTIFGTLGAFVAAFFGGPILSPTARGWLGVVPDEAPKKLFGVLPYSLLADLISYGSIFLVVVIVLSLISHVLAETAKSLGLGAVDRTFGVIFGLLRGIVLLGLLYLPVYLMAPVETKESWFAESKTHFYLEKTSALLAKALPDSTVKDIEQKVVEGAQSTREKLQNIDVLQKEDGADGAEKKDGKNGYTEDFREDMDHLFENKSDKNYND